MKRVCCCLPILLLLPLTPPANADVVVEYTVDAGGDTSAPLNGLAARATFRLIGTDLQILLENTSVGVPEGFGVADSLIVSLGMNLADTLIVTGDAAVIGPDSEGLGAWSDRGPGDSVGEEWVWTNDAGGDLLHAYAQVLSTSMGLGGGDAYRFDGEEGSVNGPFGGIAAAPPIIAIPDPQRAVSDSIQFDLTLSDTMTEDELALLARNSIVEFGGDARYLVPVPEPAALLMLALAPVFLRLRRR